MCAMETESRSPPSPDLQKIGNSNGGHRRNNSNNNKRNDGSAPVIQHSPSATNDRIASDDSNSSTASSSSSSSSYNSDSGNSSTSDDAKTKTRTFKGSSSASSRLLLRRQTSLSEASLHVTSGSLVSALVVVFSVYFPFALAPWAASQTYRPAWYLYDSTKDHVFCNSAWTYVTDYGLAICMGLLLYSITVNRNSVSYVQASRSRGLLACYCLSVIAGGLAHQFYHTLDSRNTWHFRLLWTICVGCVTAASAWMGSIGTELARIDASEQQQQRDARGYNKSIVSIPILPEYFWIAFGTLTTAVCAAGGISFQRPACDIFIAGITQFPSTFYMMLLMGMGLQGIPLPNWARITGVLGFILNAPLLPLYPLLVQYTSWSTAAINTLLHTWLLVAWGLQGLALRRLEQALVQHATNPSSSSSQPLPSSIPMRRPKSHAN